VGTVSGTSRGGRASACCASYARSVSIAPSTSGVRARTRALDDPGPLLDLLPDESPLSWVRGADGLVGWGVAARWTGVGPDRFADADDWWRAFVAGVDVQDEVGAPGTGPVAFASFTFGEDSPGSVLVVPRVVVGRHGDTAWITEFARGDGPSAVRSIAPVRPTGTLRFAVTAPPYAKPGARHVIAASVTLDERRFGPVGEGIVRVEGT